LTEPKTREIEEALVCGKWKKKHAMNELYTN